MDPRSTLRRVTHRAVSALLATAVLAFLFVFVAQATGRYRFVPVLSGSMAPFVDAGDVAVLRPIAASDLSVGEVIAFEAPVAGSPLTLHRVVEIVSPAPELVIRTQGDANRDRDPWAARLDGDRLWRATSHVDGLGTPVLFVHRAKTRFVLISAAALLIGWWGLAAIWRRPSEPEPVGDPRGSRSKLPLATGSLAVLALLVSGYWARSSAAGAFTDAAAGRQLVSSARWTAPFTLEADLLCSGGVPSSVELRWTAASEPVAGYAIYRGGLTGGPYDTLVGQTRGDTLTFSDPLVGLSGGLPLNYVVRTIDPVFPEEETNEASALVLCDGPVLLAP